MDKVGASSSGAMGGATGALGFSTVHVAFGEKECVGIKP